MKIKNSQSLRSLLVFTMMGFLSVACSPQNAFDSSMATMSSALGQSGFAGNGNSNSASGAPSSSPPPSGSNGSSGSPSADPAQYFPAPGQARPANASNLSVCAKGSTAPGVDVSVWDSTPSWTTAKGSGIQFAYAKATEGTWLTDAQFANNWPSLKAQGILRGAYHFFHPGTDGTLQANYFLSVLGNLQVGDMPPMLDWEVTDGVSNAQQIASAQAWLNAVQSATGKVPMIYVSPSFWNALGNPSQFFKYPLYIANYEVNCPEIPPPWNTWTLWQTSGTGSASGFTGQVDLDLFNGLF